MTDAVSADPDHRAAALVAQLSLDEKILLVYGRTGWVTDGERVLRPINREGEQPPAYLIAPPGAIGSDGFVPGIPRLGIPAQQLGGAAVGPTDMANQRDDHEVTVFPSPMGQSATWDPELTQLFGRTSAAEAAHFGFNIYLAGACNLAVDPHCGRLFEYRSEDPLLAARMVAGELRGTQEGGLVATIKHYAANFQETGRYFVDSIVDERSLREGELLVFELAIAESDVGAVMSSYNKLNGVYTSESPYLINEVLKGEWGFKGWVMSDWGAQHSTVPAALAGLDQEIPTCKYFGDALKDAIANGEVPLARLDDMCQRILRSMIAVGLLDGGPTVGPIDYAADATIAQRIAEESIVLLSNDGLLPLSAPDAPTIAVIGRHADVGVISGGGSGSVWPAGGFAVPVDPAEYNPFKTEVWVPSSPLAELAAKVGADRVSFHDGSDRAAAAAVAAEADVAVVFAIQRTEEDEDVPDLHLPDGQDELIAAVAAANPNTIVVLETGGPILTPWAGRVRAVLAAWYPGQRGATAIANVLFGDVTPSGKLPVTFPRTQAELPRQAPGVVPLRPGAERPAAIGPESDYSWAVQPYEVHYDEGLFIGYKWYDANDVEPAFCFGHGLSYTTFELTDLAVAADATVSVTVRNAGERSGAEVVQVYAALPAEAGEPPRRLVGWAKVRLDPGASERVEITVPAKLLSIWAVEAKRWQLVDGAYELHVGTSSRDLRLSAPWAPERVTAAV